MHANGGSSTNAINSDAYTKGGISTGAKIKLFTDSDISVLTRDSNGKTQYEPMPRYISLGHELIHALRLMGGNAKPLNNSNMGFYVYRTPDGDIKKISSFYEELETTGISYTKYDDTNINAWLWYTTENALRDEHGLNRRVKY